MTSENAKRALRRDAFRRLVNTGASRERGAILASLTTLAVAMRLDAATLPGVVDEAERSGWITVRDGCVYAARPSHGVPDVVKAADYLRAVARSGTPETPLGTATQLAAGAGVATQTMTNALLMVGAEGLVDRAAGEHDYVAARPGASQRPRGGLLPPARRPRLASPEPLRRAAMDARVGSPLGTLDELAGAVDVAQYATDVVSPLESGGWLDVLPDRVVVAARPPAGDQPERVRVMDGLRARADAASDGARLGTEAELAEALGVSAKAIARRRWPTRRQS